MSEKLHLNLVPKLPQAAFLHELVPLLWQYSDVIGIWLEGSMGRGQADLYSDVDLYVGIEPTTFEKWRGLDIPALFGESYAAHRTSNFTDELFVFHIFMTAGRTYDLHIQSQARELPDVERLILGCREAAYAQTLAAGQGQKLFVPQPIEPETIQTLLIA